MAGGQANTTISLNARVGSVALAVCGPANLLLHTQASKLGPLSYAFWLGLTLGLLCFCEEMGARRPLNRAGGILLAAAFCGDTLALLAVDPAMVARAWLLYAFAILGAVILWSVALMHRRKAPKAVGAVGAAVGASAIVLLIAAHLLLGTVTVFGFSQLFAAIDNPGALASLSLIPIDAILCVWSLMIAVLLLKVRLRTDAPVRDSAEPDRLTLSDHRAP